MRLEELTRNQLEDLMIRHFPDEPTEEALPKVKEMFAGTDFVEENFFEDRTNKSMIILYDPEIEQFLSFTRSDFNKSHILISSYDRFLNNTSDSLGFTKDIVIEADDKKSLIENVINYLTGLGFEMNRYYDVDEEELSRLFNIKSTYHETMANEIKRYIGQ